MTETVEPTTPRDDIGLSERLRERTRLLGQSPDSILKFMDRILPLIEEAATALDALHARVEELEVEIPQLLTEQRRKLCAEHDKDITELNRVRRVSKEAIEAAESRATSAEQQRDEALERLKPLSEVVLPWGNVGSGMVSADAVLAARDLVRRLAAGTEKEGK